VDSRFKFFQRLVAAPYLLALLGLLLPLFNVSCADQVIAEPSYYEMANGIDLEQTLKEPALGYIKKMETGNPAAIERFKESIPDFPRVQPIPKLYGIAGALVIAAIFALIAPYGYYASLGSVAMGMLAMVSMWAFLAQMGKICSALGMNVLSVEPATGIYCASFLIIIGSAMNMAVIARPIVDEIRAKRAAKKAIGQ
jgi:hypothetical protein